MLLESLEIVGGQAKGGDDEFIQYPVRLEQALMEGSYDRVWGETKGNRVPGEEFAVFSEVCHSRGFIGLANKNRYSSTPSATKSLHALKRRMDQYQSPMQRIYSSSIPKVRLWTLPRREVGLLRTVAYGSQFRSRICWHRRRTS